jgi:hypothetical protein
MLACSHGILPRVLDGKSQVLDQGRTKRLYTPPQRLALADRDHGQTTLNNAALLCARHHHWVHSEGIDGRIQDNRVQFQIHGIWQTNHRWRP